MTLLCLLLLGTGPLPALADLPAPIGRLDGVLQRPEGGAQSGEKIVEAKLKGCARAVPINVNRFIAGTLFAFQQLVEWMNRHPGLQAAVFPAGALDEVSAQVAQATHLDQRACAALPSDVLRAPKLCQGAAADQAWLAAAGKVSALVRWSPASGKDKCLPRVTAVLFDASGKARVRYDADFGGAASAALLGEGCHIAFTFDAKNEVFHPAARGCKGP